MSTPRPGSPAGRPDSPNPRRPAPGFVPSESQFLGLVTDAAELYGWRWAHFRPARTAHGWRTPVSGPLGAGWPDLVMTRDRDGRMILAELKVPGGVVSDTQTEVLVYLARVAKVHGWLTVAVWRPADFEAIVAALT
jgi:hypothetical protein